MKIKLHVSGSWSIHSGNEEVFDLEEDLGITPEEWAGMSDDEKFKIAEEWAYNCGLEIGYEEVDE